MPQPDIRQDVGRKSWPSVWWPTMWLAVVLVAVKATYVGASAFWDWATPRDYLSWLYTQWVAAAAHSDLLFALGAGAVAAIALRAAHRRPRIAQFMARAFFSFGIVCVIYAIVAREFFAYAAAPLTFQLLTLGGRPNELMSSLEPFLTAPAIVALIGTPAAYIVLVRVSATIVRRQSRRSRIVGTSLSLAVLLGWLLLGRNLLGSDWFKAQDRYLPDSPHWVLAESSALNVVGARHSLGSVGVRQEDVCQILSKGGDSARQAGTLRTTENAGPRPHNVILIVLESVGAQFLGVYGSKLATTPRLSGEQRNSLVFDAYYTPVGWTAYSLYSMVLSQRPPLKGYDIESFRLKHTDGETLANVLSKRGYKTAFMAAGDPDWASEGFFEGKGFADVVHLSKVRGAKKVSSWGVSDRLLFDGMIDWVDHHQQDPFFLMVWTDQTHHPYQLAPDQVTLDLLPPDLKGHEDLDRYVTLIHEVDAQIGRLFDTLRARGLANNTLVAITGDHGEAFGIQRRVSGHGFTVYDEELRVPLVLWNPLLFAGAERSAHVGTHIDLSATLLDVLGLPPSMTWDGRSLLAPGESSPAYLFAAGWGENLMGVREENWKFVFDARQGREELYDLRVDPGEQHNVVGVNPERALRLRQKLAARLRVDKVDSESLAVSCR